MKIKEIIVILILVNYMQMNFKNRLDIIFEQSYHHTKLEVMVHGKRI